MVPGSLGWASVVFAAMTMLAPSRAARSAIARPMPRLAPVMKRVFPARVPVAMGCPFEAWCAAARGCTRLGEASLAAVFCSSGVLRGRAHHADAALGEIACAGVAEAGFPGDELAVGRGRPLEALALVGEAIDE